jgi:hypothetical protein
MRRQPESPIDQPVRESALWTERHILVRPIRVMRRIKRRNRWVLRGVLAVPFLALIGGVVLTRTAVTRWLVVPQLERALNMQVDAEAVYVGFDGQLVVQRARFRLPGLDGPAGDFLKVARIEARVDWLASLRGPAKLRGIRMNEPVVVVSHSLDDGSLNISKLSLPASSGSMALPMIIATNAGIELAEHSSSSYTVLKHVQMDGRLSPSKEDPNGYTFLLTEKSTRARQPGQVAEPGFKLNGVLGSEGSLLVKVVNFSLDEWPDSSMPTVVRDRFREMNLAGEVPEATVSYTKLGGLQAKLKLSGVGMDLPIEPAEFTTLPEGDEPPEVLVGPPPRNLRMHGVTGEVQFTGDQVIADVRGLVENMPYHVELRYDGTSGDSPFRVTFTSNDFRVDRNPRLLPYAPPVVKYRLATFSSPTAVVNTRLVVERGEPVDGEPGEISLSGEMEMRDGVAAYEGFPYEFRGLHGLFRFTDDSLEIVKLQGQSLSGAKLAASGVISPLSDDAQVTINVDVTEAPIDDAMQESFGPGRGEIVPSLFSLKRYDELRAAGLIQTPEEAANARAELERLRQGAATGEQVPPDQLAAAERHAAIPEFAFRGKADVSVRVHRPAGANVEWQTDVRISLPRVGLLPEKFPLPIQATNVVAVVNNRDGRVVSGEFRGLTGGEAKVDASFNIPFAADKDKDVRPDINIQAAAIPIDALLIHALPGAERADGSGFKRILRGLGLSGTGAGRVHIAARENGQLGFDADFGVQHAEAQPPGSPVGVGGVSGRVRASESRVDVNMDGYAKALGREGAWLGASGPLTLHVGADIPPENSGKSTTYAAELGIPALSLNVPVEHLVRVFSAKAADKIAELREQTRPTGSADVRVLASGGDGTRVAVEASGKQPVGFDGMGGRFTLQPGSGLVRIDAAEATTVRAEDLRGQLTYKGEPAGGVLVSGGLVLGGEAAEAPATLSVKLQDAPLESPLVAKVAQDRIGEPAGKLLTQLLPRGLFNADLAVSRSEAGELDVRGSLTPRSLTVRAAGSDLTFSEVRGQVEFGPGAGAIRQLALIAPQWAATASVVWSALGAGNLQAQAEIGLRGDAFTSELADLLPRDVATLLRDISFAASGPFQLKGGTLALSRGETAETRFTGVLEVEDASVDVGAEIRKLAGQANITFERLADAPPKFELVTRADHFETGGIAMSSGYAVVRNGEQAGEVLIPEASAQAHGGRVVAEAKIFSEHSEGSTDPLTKSFTAKVNASGLRFASLLKDLEPNVNTPADEDDRSRGLVEAAFTLQGQLGKPETRRGRGSFQIDGGRVLNLPFMMRMIELSNLQLPMNAKLEYARGRFYLAGGLITFEDLGVYSRAVQILGSGTVTWPEKRLNLRFDTRPARGIPLLSGLLRGIRDELVTTSIGGTLAEPDVQLKQFPGPRRMLDRVMGAGTDQPPVDGPGRGERIAEGIRPSKPVRR